LWQPTGFVVAVAALGLRGHWDLLACWSQPGGGVWHGPDVAVRLGARMGSGRGSPWPVGRLLRRGGSEEYVFARKAWGDAVLGEGLSAELALTWERMAACGVDGRLVAACRCVVVGRCLTHARVRRVVVVVRGPPLWAIAQHSRVAAELSARILAVMSPDWRTMQMTPERDGCGVQPTCGLVDADDVLAMCDSL
jgi:hypothetical protein